MGASQFFVDYCFTLHFPNKNAIFPMDMQRLLIAIVEQNVEEETRHFVGLEYWSPLSAGRRYEIGIQNRYLGAKAPVSGNLDAGLKASSTVSGQVQSP